MARTKRAPTNGPSMPERNRAFRVMLYGLSEETRIMQLSKEERRERLDSIIDSCYGDLPPDRRPSTL